jgi:exopolysaccharide production protein ExoQ
MGATIVILELLALLVMVVVRWRHLFGILANGWLFLCFPVFAIASFAWSDVPAVSLRYGIQLFVTIFAGLMIATAVSWSRFALVVFCGTSIASVLGILSGRMGGSEQGPVLIGLAGSKNQAGYTSVLWLVACVAVALDTRRNAAVRMGALIATAPAAFMIYQANATTAAVSAVIGLFLLLALALSTRLRTETRLFAVFACMLLSVGLTAAAPQIVEVAETLRTDVLKKDARLTGRTLLWEEADRLISERPVAGHGYKAIWLGPEGVGLLARNKQSDGRAFNFHDTFREILADLGIVGLVAFGVAMIYAVLKLGIAVVLKPSLQVAFALTVLLLIFLRFRTEVVLGPFSLDTVVCYAILAYAWRLDLQEGPIGQRRSGGKTRASRHVSSLRDGLNEPEEA